jgi:small-conductance mechanosensitive channel
MNLFSTLSENFSSTLSTVFCILLIYGVIYVLAGKLIKLDRKIKKVRMRALYLCSIVFVISLARIWVDGFTQLLTVLGLISAGLVISNKEPVMNLTSWLILNWREVFTEGDLIQISDKIGYVKSIGPFFITLDEALHQSGHLKTARIIKLPNYHAIVHPIINFTYETKPTLQKMSLLFTPQSDITAINTVLSSALQLLTEEAKEMRTKAQNKKISAKNNAFESRDYHLSFDLSVHDSVSLEVTVYFYSYENEYDQLKYNFLQNVLPQIEASPHLSLL